MWYAIPAAGITPHSPDVGHRQMNIIPKQTAIVAGIHFAITVVSAVAMRLVFTFDAVSRLQQIANYAVYAIYIVMLQPLAIMSILLERTGIRMADGWFWAIAFLVTNSLLAAAILVSLWNLGHKGLRKRFGQQSPPPYGSPAAGSPSGEA